MSSAIWRKYLWKVPFHSGKTYPSSGVLTSTFTCPDPMRSPLSPLSTKSGLQGTLQPSRNSFGHLCHRWRSHFTDDVPLCVRHLNNFWVTSMNIKVVAWTSSLLLESSAYHIHLLRQKTHCTLVSINTSAPLHSVWSCWHCRVCPGLLFKTTKSILIKTSGTWLFPRTDDVPYAHKLYTALFS